MATRYTTPRKRFALLGLSNVKLRPQSRTTPNRSTCPCWAHEGQVSLVRAALCAAKVVHRAAVHPKKSSWNLNALGFLAWLGFLEPQMTQISQIFDDNKTISVHSCLFVVQALGTT